MQLSAGMYVAAPIELKSNITLQLDKGATLLGSPDHQDYPPHDEFRLPDLQPLVSAIHATNVAIIGEGVIDGNGESWWQEARSIKDHGILGTGHPRPKLILFDHCAHVRVEGITVQNSPMWQVVPYYSDDVVIRNVKILAPAARAQYGCDRSVFLVACASSTTSLPTWATTMSRSNRALSIRLGPDSPSRDITITDCTFLHGHGLSVGSEIAGGAQNIRAERIHFEGTDNGIRIKANRDRGNDVSHLVFRDIEMKDVKNALIISEYYPAILPPDQEEREACDAADAAFSRHHA